MPSDSVTNPKTLYNHYHAIFNVRKGVLDRVFGLLGCSAADDKLGIYLKRQPIMGGFERVLNEMRS